eukprot:3825617-Amphidinium_carterae.1
MMIGNKVVNAPLAPLRNLIFYTHIFFRFSEYISFQTLICIWLADMPIEGCSMQRGPTPACLLIHLQLNVMQQKGNGASMTKVQQADRGVVAAQGLATTNVHTSTRARHTKIEIRIQTPGQVWSDKYTYS